MRIIVINGPNLNRLGNRNSEFYGHHTLEQINSELVQEFPEVTFEFFQSNSEGEIINKLYNLGNNFDGIIINPGAFSHYSLAIMDALAEINLPKMEVHLSNLAKREKERQNLITATVVDGVIMGLKEKVYSVAVLSLMKIINSTNLVFNNK